MWSIRSAARYYVEALTAELVAQGAGADRARSKRQGGMTEGRRGRHAKTAIEKAAAMRQARIDRGEEVIVGVNRFRVEEAHPIDVRDIDNARVREEQVARLARSSAARDPERSRRRLATCGLPRGATGNLLAAAIVAARARATLGEISAAMEDVFGRHAAMTRVISGVYGESYAGIRICSHADAACRFARGTNAPPRSSSPRWGRTVMTAAPR